MRLQGFGYDVKEEPEVEMDESSAMLTNLLKETGDIVDTPVAPAAAAAVPVVPKVATATILPKSEVIKATTTRRKVSSTTSRTSKSKKNGKVSVPKSAPMLNLKLDVPEAPIDPKRAMAEAEAFEKEIAAVKAKHDKEESAVSKLGADVKKARAEEKWANMHKLTSAIKSNSNNGPSASVVAPPEAVDFAHMSAAQRRQKLDDDHKKRQKALEEKEHHRKLEGDFRKLDELTSDYELTTSDYVSPLSTSHASTASAIKDKLVNLHVHKQTPEIEISKPLMSKDGDKQY
jgi:hypothetical protein